MSLKVSGQIKEAQLENLAADPANLPHGRAWYDNVLHKIKVSLNGAAKILVSEDGTQTLTNKTIVAADNTITTAAVGNLSATNLNSALAELQTDIDSKGTSISDHLADATDAHDASAISSVASGNLAATDVQSALNELQTDIDTRATTAALAAHASATATHGVGEIVGRTEIQTLQSKTLDTTNIVNIKDSSFTLHDQLDATKQLKFEVNGITTGNTRTLTIPDASTTVVGHDTSQTLTNKNLSDSTTAIVDNSDATKKILFDAGGTTGTTSTITGAQTGNRVLTLPDATTTLVGTDTTQSLTNKTLLNSCIVTLHDDRFTLQDQLDTTKQAQFQLSSISTGTTRTYTLPNASDTVAVLGTAQTFSAAQTFSSAINLTSGQITFPAAQSASAGANTLDDYEEGTWTPTIVGLSTAGTGTYTTQQGRYTKIGRVVTFNCRVATSAHTGTGAMSLQGFPFTNDAYYVGFTFGYIHTVTLSANNYLQIHMTPSSTRADFYQSPTGGGSASTVSMDGTIDVMVSGSYIADA